MSLSVLFSVIQISSGELQSSKELSEVVKDAYYLGEQSKGGGAIGAVAAVPLAKLLGDIGAVIPLYRYSNSIFSIYFWN